MKRALLILAVAVLGAALWWSLKPDPTTTTTTEPTPGDTATPAAPPPLHPDGAPAPLDAGQDAGPLPTLRGEVRDETGGVAQATVELRRRGKPEEQSCTSEATTTTVGGGGFELGPLCPGQYDVRATRGENVATAVARLARGVTHDLLFLLLREGSRLTVRVRDGKKQPLAGADVHVQDEESGFLLELVSGADGLAVANGLSPRPHSIWAGKDGYLGASMHDHTLPPGEDQVTLTLIAGVRFEGRVLGPDGAPLDEVWVRLSTARKELGGGYDTVDGDTSKDGGEFSIGPVLPGAYSLVATHRAYMRLEQPVRAPGPRATLKLSRGASIDGVFLDADGAPVASGDVHADNGPQGDDRNTEVDELGRFQLEGLAKGRWALVGLTRSEDGGSPGIAIQQLEVKQETALRVTLQLERGLSIEGRCQNSDGSQPDTEILAIERSLFDKLRLSGFDPTRVAPGSISMAPCTGRFTISGLKPGRYAVVGCGTEDEVDPLLANAGDRDVTVTCAHGSVRFRLVDPNHRPVEKFSVGRGDPPPDAHPDGRFERSLFGETDEVLVVRAPGYAPLQRRLQAKRGESIDLGELTVTPSRRVQGRVVEGGSNQPVGGAEVSFGVPHGDSLHRARTRPDGTFELLDVAREGGTLYAEHPKYQRSKTELAASQDQVTVTLSQGLQLSGAVITRDGREPRDFAVEAHGSSRTVTAPVVDGRYTLDSLEPGEWRLRLEGPDVSAFDPQTVTLVGQGSVSADFVERLGGVRVVVLPVDEEGQPVVALAWLLPGRRARPASDAEASALAASAGIGSEGDPSGSHTFDSVSPGPYTALLRAKGVPGMVWTESFEVSQGMASPLRLFMPRGLQPLK